MILFVEEDYIIYINVCQYGNVNKKSFLLWKKLIKSFFIWNLLLNESSTILINLRVFWGHEYEVSDAMFLFFGAIISLCFYDLSFSVLNTFGCHTTYLTPSLCRKCFSLTMWLFDMAIFVPYSKVDSFITRYV